MVVGVKGKIRKRHLLPLTLALSQPGEGTFGTHDLNAIAQPGGGISTRSQNKNRRVLTLSASPIAIITVNNDEPP
jgi:hypothetical protein